MENLTRAEKRAVEIITAEILAYAKEYKLKDLADAHRDWINGYGPQVTVTEDLLFQAIEHKLLGKHEYMVEIWGCVPGTDDLCITGKETDNLKEAHEWYSQPFSHFKGLEGEPVLWAEISEDGVPQGKRCLRNIKVPKGCDDDWKREQAMQNGMAFGCQGYNDTMGY